MGVNVTLTDDQTAFLIAHCAAMGVLQEDALTALICIPPKVTQRPWTPNELDLLRNPANTPRAIARQLPHRTVAAISARRYQLALEEERPDLQRRSRSHPPNLELERRFEQERAARGLPNVVTCTPAEPGHLCCYCLPPAKPATKHVTNSDGTPEQYYCDADGPPLS